MNIEITRERVGCAVVYPIAPIVAEACHLSVNSDRRRDEWADEERAPRCYRRAKIVSPIATAWR